MSAVAGCAISSKSTIRVALEDQDESDELPEVLVKRIALDRLRRALPGPVREAALAVASAGDKLGVGIHLVGGPVRDFLLDRPLRDLDLLAEPRDAKTGKGDAAAVVAAAQLGGARVVVHERFGTVRIEQEGFALDVATVRSERYDAPGALPTVAPGGLDEDLLRRDFTVNAMAAPLNATARRGRSALIDPGGGLVDLERGLMRVFHPRSFRDDPTRALRAARLVPRLGMALARPSRSALRAALREGAFGAVKGERYQAEFEKLFEDPVHGLDPSRALRLLEEWHVLAALEPGLLLPPTARTPLRRLGRDLSEAPASLQPWLSGFMVWLGPLPAPLRRRVLRRFAVRGRAAERIVAYPRTAARVLRGLARRRGRGATDASLRGLGAEELQALAAEAPTTERRRVLRWLQEDRAVRLPVSGRDLLELGLEGPAVGRALERIRLAVLDRKVRNREDALSLAAELARHKRRSSRRGD
ncbi:MAG: CCA tRNA nucleotidyltransferase [bacterium]|nr:CCA tRNA nucleotidyltransferase [bacterium]MCP5065517.1 CCA tRNA nucleotidyltransferase [bacterium]